MTFAARQMLPASGVVNPIPDMTIFSLDITGSGAFGTMNFLATGAISYTGGSGADKWHDPVVTGIGASYYVKFTLSSGNAWDSGLTSGTVYQLNATRSLTWTVSGIGGKAAVVAVAVYSDAGGTALEGSGTLTVSVSSESGA